MFEKKAKRLEVKVIYTAVKASKKRLNGIV